jgi:hypothetical protein
MKRWSFFWWELVLLVFEIVLLFAVGVAIWLIVFEE